VIVNLVVYWFEFLLLANIYRIKIIQIVVQLSVPLQIYKFDRIDLNVYGIR